MLLRFGFFSRFGFGQFTKPVFLFSLVVLSISIIFTALILAGSTAPAVRKFYLISLNYNPSSTASKILSGLDKIDDKIDNKLDDLFSKPGNDTSKDTSNFSLIRVGYRGLCIEHSSGWDCAKDSAALGHIAGDLSGDPLDLVTIADIYRDKITFSFPIWVAVISLAVGWIGIAINCIPGIPIPGLTKKVAAAGCTIGTLSLLGAMTLQQVTSGAVSTLVQKMGMSAVEIKIGTANIGFGWAAFALACLATIGITAIVTAEWGIATAQAKVTQKGGEFVERATGGHVRMGDFSSDVEGQLAKPESTQPSLGTSTMRAKVTEEAFKYGKKAAIGAFNSHGHRP